MAVKRSAAAMDYSRATAKHLVDDFFGADSKLRQLLGEIRWVGDYMRDPRLRDDPKLTKARSGFFREAFRLLPYFVAVLETAAPEIAKRANKNQVNKSFGLLKVALLRADTGAQEQALQNLQHLGWGIAKNKVWFHPDGNAGWNSQVNLALTEQLNRFSNLGLRETFEYMVDNRFAVVANAIKQRLVDELRALYRQQPSQHVSDDFLESVPSPEPSPEEMAQFDSLVRLLESPAGELQNYERRIYAAVEVVIQDHNLPAMTVAQARAELVRQAAAGGNVSLRQSRKDLQKLTAEKDKHFERLANRLSVSPSQWRRGRNYRRKRPVPGVDEDDSA